MSHDLYLEMGERAIQMVCVTAAQTKNNKTEKINTHALSNALDFLTQCHLQVRLNIQVCGAVEHKHLQKI